MQLDNNTTETEASRDNYYAVRRADKYGLRSCIFLHWKDCQKYLEGHGGVEFGIFHHAEEAIGYLSMLEDRRIIDQSTDETTTHKEDTKSSFTNVTKPSTRVLSPEKVTRPGRSDGRKALVNPNRRPTKTWLKMYDKLEKYKKENSSLVITDTKEHAALHRWVRGQRSEYKYFKEGKPSSMFQLKVDKLVALGFEFNYISVKERFRSLLEFKESQGTYNIPLDHPTLGKWVEKQRQSARKLANGDPSQYFDNIVKNLNALGVDLQNRSISSNIQSAYCEEERKWDELFNQLKTYKKKNGTCEVPPSQHTPLSYWVTKQHQDYIKIKEGENSKLTVYRLQRLNDLGFVFRKMAKTYTWDERMAQLRKYKAEHAHTRVPKSHPQLGVFVNRQRYEYGKWIQGRPTTMNEKRKQGLEELGFQFVAGKKMNHVDFKNKKTWDERYDELLGYHDLHGHTVVPQSYPGLGEWVHTQRTYYKKLKLGKSSPLTSERVLKLADVGFVFDATKKRGNHVTIDDNKKPIRI